MLWKLLNSFVEPLKTILKLKIHLIKLRKLQEACSGYRIDIMYLFFFVSE